MSPTDATKMYDAGEARFRRIHRRLHAGHARCRDDEWLTEPCRGTDGEPVDRPVVWSRRNGAWRRVSILWVGAAPGNAGGRGDGELGAHGTRIPFGGDIAGANLDVLFASIGLSRNDTFITAALNRLPERGGGEPRVRELVAPAGDYASSIHALHDTMIAAGPRLLVALGNVAVRTVFAAARLDAEPLRLPTLRRLRRTGIERGRARAWPDEEPPAERMLSGWREAWRDAPMPHLLWLTHPSAQNMSPYAGLDTGFHTRMRAARDALRAAVEQILGREPPNERPSVPLEGEGVYGLPAWRERVGPRHRELDSLWSAKGV
ncbi:MAG: uracil-DNA glycosylase family protein [Gemmatimonadota bacterium]